MEYQVRAYGVVHGTFPDREKAVEFATDYPAEAWAQVIAHEVSGTYESRTCIWPTKGETYSN